MAKINVRSPHYITTGVVTGLNSTSIEIYVYTGTQTTSRPTTPTYNLEGFAVNNEVTFEISELVKDYVVQIYTEINYSTEILWVDYRTTQTINGVKQTQSAFIQLTAFNGYGYFEDGANPTNSSKLLQTNEKIFLPSSDGVSFDKVKIPVDTTLTRTVFFRDASGTTIETVTIPTTTVSSTQVAYATGTSIDIDSARLTGTGTDIIVNIERVTECKYTQRKLTFVNKFGALQYIWFNKKSTETLTTKKEAFKRNIVSGATYSTLKHQDAILTKNGKEKITLNSGYYPESFNEVFKQMELSEQVWMTEGVNPSPVTRPVTVTSSSLAFKTQLNDNLINYTIEVEYSNNTINDIR